MTKNSNKPRIQQGNKVLWPRVRVEHLTKVDFQAFKVTGVTRTKPSSLPMLVERLINCRLTRDLYTMLGKPPERWQHNGSWTGSLAEKKTTRKQERYEKRNSVARLDRQNNLKVVLVVKQRLRLMSTMVSTVFNCLKGDLSFTLFAVANLWFYFCNQKC